MTTLAHNMRTRLTGVLDTGAKGDKDSLRRRLTMTAWLVPRRLVAALAAVSVVGALCEATTLLVLIQAITAIAADEQVVEFSAVPGRTYMVSVDHLLVLAGVLATTRLVLHLMNSYLAARSSSLVLLRLRKELLDSFLQASWKAKSAEREGSLQELATTHALQASQAALFVALAVTAAINFAVMVLSAVAVSYVAAGVMAAAVVLLYLIFRPLTRVGRAKAARFAESNRAYASTVSEGASLALESTTFGVERQVNERLSERSRDSAHRFFQMQLITRSLSGVYQNIAILLVVVGIWFISGQGQAELSTLGAIVVILLRALSYSQNFQVAQHTVNERLPFAYMLREEIDAFESERRTSGSLPLPAIQSFEFDSVGFGYEGSPVLQEVSFSLRAGEAVGIVGPSGAGKSTLAQLLLRLRLPESGRYLVNATDAEEFDLDDWRARVSFVPQEPHILQGTVSENVRFFRDIDDEAIEQACRAAHIHDEILGWSDGYQTVLGSGNNLLSGGQRQRLCIARALAGDPELLVLDEPTSALDMRSEAAFQKSLEELRGRVTLVIIAHRVPTLQLCERVMVYEGGRLVALDTPEQLLENSHFFAEAMRLSRR